MTAVAAIEHNGHVYLAGDAAFSTDDAVWIQSEPKVFRRGAVVIGIAGRARWESLLRYVVDVPPFRRDQDPARWANVDLATAIRKAATHEGYEHESGFIEFEGCIAMVGIAGKLFVIEPDLAAWRPLCGYHAIGSGGEHARVSLSETRDRMQPKTRLKRALERAAEKTPFVRPPFSFVSTEK
jgi:ATP-dependent protease HslVU (ClpYQ) peptidase subunit